MNLKKGLERKSHRMIDIMFLILISFCATAIIFYTAGYFTGKATERKKVADLLDTYYSEFLELDYDEYR